MCTKSAEIRQMVGSIPVDHRPISRRGFIKNSAHWSDDFNLGVNLADTSQII